MAGGLLELGELQDHVRSLASLSATPAPFITCYARVERALIHDHVVAERVEELRRSFEGEEAVLFEEALVPIERLLSTDLKAGSLGVAVFSRAGPQPFFLALQF